MNNTLLFVASNILSVVLTAVAAYVFVRAKPGIFTTRFVVALIVLTALLLGIHWYSYYDNTTEPFWRWYFDFDKDGNLPTIAASIIWLLIGVTLLSHAFRPDIPLLQRLYWVFMGAAFFYLSADDYFGIHEQFVVEGSWRRLYLFASIAFALINLAALLLWFRQELPRYNAVAVILGAGLVVLVLSGLLMETFFLEMVADVRNTELWVVYTDAFEELWEQLSTIVILAGLLVFTHSKLSQIGWVRLRRWLIAAPVIATVVFSLYLWPTPALEAKLLMTPVHVEFNDDEVELLGYWLTNDVAAPDSRIRVFLYWTSTRQISDEYRLSLHLVSHPDVESYAQADRFAIGQVPSFSWLPGMTVRKSVHIDLPADIPSPASYWLVLRVWSGRAQADWLDTEGLPVTETDRTLLGDDMVVLGSISVPADDSPSLPSQQPVFRYDAGFTLSNYALPEQVDTDEALHLQFRWQTQNRIDSRLTQFVHVFSEPDHEFVQGHDQEPFGGSFPTSDWPGGIDVLDTLDLTLPPDLPPGSYSVYTGLYDTLSNERAAVHDATGAPVLDNVVRLGTFQLGPTEP